MSERKSVLFMLALGLVIAAADPAQARRLEIDVHGMTCAFCVDSLQRSFGKIDAVKSIEISLELNKVRLETEAGLPDTETIRQIILDAGFTPVKIIELPPAAD